MFGEQAVSSSQVQNIQVLHERINLELILKDKIINLLEPFYTTVPECPNTLLSDKVAKELSRTFTSLKEIMLLAIQVNAIVPALSATLEYIKAVASDNLPTSMYSMWFLFLDPVLNALGNRFRGNRVRLLWTSVSSFPFKVRQTGNNK